MSDTLRLTAGLILAAFSILGYGRLTSKLLKIEGTLAADGVIGTAILTAIFTVVHFFFALQQTVNLIVLAPGICLLLVLFQRRSLAELLVISVVVWWSVELSRTGWWTYDQGLYHLQTMVWDISKPAILGLANLHTRFGFNHALFVFSSGFCIPVFGGWSLSFLATALVEAVIAADFLLSIRAAAHRIARLYALVVVLFLLAAPRWILSPTYLSPEPVIAIGVLYAILLHLDRRETALLVVVPFLITAKLSSLPLILLLDWNPATLRKPAAALGALFLAIWVAGNIILSGYLAFPVAFTRLPLPWAVERARAVDAANWITSWARMPGVGLDRTTGLQWLRTWANNSYADQQLRWALLLFVSGILVLARKKAFRGIDLKALAVIAAGLMFWFALAPDPRFGRGFIFSAALLMVAYAVESIDVLRLAPGNTAFVVGLLACCLGFSAAQIPPPEKWPNNIDPPVELAKTPSGYNIWTPKDHEQCFAVLPCSPEPNMIQYYPKVVIPLAPK